MNNPKEPEVPIAYEVCQARVLTAIDCIHPAARDPKVMDKLRFIRDLTLDLEQKIEAPA